MSASVKVPVSVLLTAAQKQLDELLAKKAKRKAVADANAEAKKKAIKASLEAALKKPSVVSLDSRYRHGRHETTLQVPLVAKLEREPNWTYSDDNAVNAITEDIKLLSITSQTDITVRSGSNFARYI